MTKSMRVMVLDNIARKSGDASLIEMLNEAYQMGIQSTYAPSDEVVDDDEADDSTPRYTVAEEDCKHPNIAFEPDIFEGGKRVSKHHWYCHDCGYLQVG